MTSVLSFHALAADTSYPIPHRPPPPGPPCLQSASTAPPCTGDRGLTRRARATRLGTTLTGIIRRCRRDAAAASVITAGTQEKFPPRLRLTLLSCSADVGEGVGPVPVTIRSPPGHQYHQVTIEYAAAASRPDVTAAGSGTLSSGVHSPSEDSRRAQPSASHCRVICALSLSASRPGGGKRVLLIHHNSRPASQSAADNAPLPRAGGAHCA